VSSRELDARVVPFPLYQRLAAAAYRTMRDKPTIHGLYEVDVTQARRLLREHKARSGEALSFTAFIAACLARAVDEDKRVQAFRKGARRLLVFDDVDVATRIEREVAGQTYVVPHVLRAANHKTVRQLHEEIRAAQVSEVQDSLTRFRFLPTFLHGPVVAAFAWLAGKRPQLWKQTMGTVGLTSVGMFVGGAGFGIPLPAPTALMLTVGGIGDKITWEHGQPVVREHLSLTISVNHDVVDGAPAARFAQRLKALIESADGLHEAVSAQALTSRSA